MMVHDGLASVVCESRTAYALISVALLVDVLASYFMVTEVWRTCANVSRIYLRLTLSMCLPVVS